MAEVDEAVGEANSGERRNAVAGKESSGTIAAGVQADGSRKRISASRVIITREK